MPELPEVETIVQGLSGPLEGRRILGVRVLRPDLLRVSPRRFSGSLRGRRFLSVGRRGKNIVLALDSGSRLVVNLGMTGRLLLRSSTGSRRPTAHAGVVFTLEGDGELVYDDVRRFGVLEVLSTDAWLERDRALGPEPLARAFTAAELFRRLARSRSPIRSWLLDQRRVAGVGNIYANEALFRARIHPARPARTLTPPQARALHRELRWVLRQAIRARGTTLRDYRDASGEEGSFSPLLEVYGRDGESCLRCGETIEREVFGNRSAFFCPACQCWSGAGHE